MIGDKFVFSKKIFAAASAFFGLIKALREGSRIECDKTDFSGDGVISWIQTIAINCLDFSLQIFRKARKLR